MRPELLPYFKDEVERISGRYGRFILINTNFSSLNHYVPNLSTAVPIASPQEIPEQANFEAGLVAHRYKIFSKFQELVPRLAKQFPSIRIIVRPHVAENHEPWHAVAAGHENVQVVHEGNVIPWILASSALVHNGCTTAVEAFVLRKPAVTYRPVVDERFDTYLPNALSYPARDEAELCKVLSQILGGELGPCDDPEHWQCARHHIAALSGPLASDLIVDVLEKLERRPGGGSPGIVRYVRGWMKARRRAREKRENADKPGHKNNEEYQRQRFPGLTLAEVRGRFDSLRALLGRFERVQVDEIEANIFRVVSRGDSR